MSWRDAAACRGVETDLFFGIDGERGPSARRREKKAKAICAGCQVRTDCLAYSLIRPERYGVFGGLTEDERKKERKNAQRRVRERVA